MGVPRILLSGAGFGESLRWRDGGCDSPTAEPARWSPSTSLTAASSMHSTFPLSLSMVGAALRQPGRLRPDGRRGADQHHDRVGRP